jgi:FixJ family two-component response regulator
MKNDNSVPIVYLVDDDEAVRDALGMLFKSIGIEHEAFGSALDFLQHYDTRRQSCLVADIRMPGLSGLELQQRLNEQRSEIPIIFITGHGDVPMAVTAMKSGAVDFLQKPFRDQDLIDRIHKALDRDGDARKGRAEREEIRARLALLTPREREVMECVARGQANKVIAMDLGVSQRTVELHRARVMKKLRLRSVAELVHAIERVGGVPASDNAAPQ